MARGGRASWLAVVVAVAGLVPLRGRAGDEDDLVLTVLVHGLRNQKGHVRVALYRDAATWTRPHEELASCSAEIRGHDASCRIRVPAAGRYAFAFLHDEDDDGAMTRGAFGFPVEGYGFSRDARSGMIPLGFERASFLLTTAARLEATVFYPL